ncbi:MAG: hypothetical protein L0Z70_11510 [Chloroflexi bacterium]|nr:hypothetical protein [Chloroflexota bacterium]
MEDKITIIEGPPPTFEAVSDGWALGLSDSPALSAFAVTRLRTFNGPGLVERCHRAWRNLQPIHLEYRSPDGLKQQTPIVAARAMEIEEGHLLVLWLRMSDEELSQHQHGFADHDDSDDPDFPDLP